MKLLKNTDIFSGIQSFTLHSVHFNERFEGFLEVFGGGGLEEKENNLVIGM